MPGQDRTHAESQDVDHLVIPEDMVGSIDQGHKDLLVKLLAAQEESSSGQVQLRPERKAPEKPLRVEDLRIGQGNQADEKEDDSFVGQELEVSRARE